MKKYFVLMVILITLAITSFACVIPFGISTVNGSGNIITEEIDVSGFNKVLVTGVGKLIVTQSDQESLTITTDDNLMQYIETNLSDGVLELGFTDDVSFEKGGGRKILDPSNSFIFNLSVIDLTSINLSGAASVDLQELGGEQFEIVLSGAGDIKIDSLTVETLVATISGAGNIEATGKVESQIVVLSGLGKYFAPFLESQQATLTINGAGGAEIWANEKLDVTINGAGNVDYFGNPSLTQEIYGLGSIKHHDD